MNRIMFENELHLQEAEAAEQRYSQLKDKSKAK